MYLKRTALLFLIIFVIAFNNVLLFGETLFFSVSPFDTEYGFSFRYSFRFWKFETEFYVPISVNASKGFFKFDVKEDSIIKRFNFEEYPYKVTYDSINNVPFSTFVNPAMKTWNATWLGTGYYGDKLFYKDQRFSIIGNDKAVNVTLYLFGFDVFVERIDDKFNIGLGKNFYLFTGEKTGVGLSYIEKNSIFYALWFVNSENVFRTLFGFTLKANSFEINIGTDDINTNSLFGNIEWKVGDMYVIGRLQGQKIRLAVEFAIW